MVRGGFPPNTTFSSLTGLPGPGNWRRWGCRSCCSIWVSLDAVEMKDRGSPFEKEDDWRIALLEHCHGVIDVACWERTLDVGRHTASALDENGRATIPSPVAAPRCSTRRVDCDRLVLSHRRISEDLRASHGR